MDEPSDRPRRRRPDPVTAMMMLVTATALLGAIWLKIKGTPVNEAAARGRHGASAAAPGPGDLGTALRRTAQQGRVACLLVGHLSVSVIELGGDRTSLGSAPGPTPVCHGGDCRGYRPDLLEFARPSPRARSSYRSIWQVPRPSRGTA